MTTSIFLKLPKEWVNSTIDISISVYATVNVVDDSWDVRVETITSPGYWAFHFLPEYKQDLYELIERRCIENYATETLKQEDYVL
jgi:hypothetical protein